MGTHPVEGLKSPQMAGMHDFSGATLADPNLCSHCNNLAMETAVEKGLGGVGTCSIEQNV